VRAVAALAELDGPLGQSHLGVDLQRARLHAERAGLQRRAGMAIDDLRAQAATRELVGEHQAGRAGADDQDIGLHENSSALPRASGPRLSGWR
jgi:hypothetical protein